jgi:hypothetical protein
MPGQRGSHDRCELRISNHISRANRQCHMATATRPHHAKPGGFPCSAAAVIRMDLILIRVI